MAETPLKSRPSWAEQDPSEAQRRLLSVLYEAFPVNEQWSWPSYGYLEAVLRRDLQLDAAQLIESMPMGLLWPDPAFGTNATEEQEYAVTIFGLTFVPEAQPYLDLFVRIVAWGAERRAAFVPPPQGRSVFELPVDDFIRDSQAERRLVEPAAVERALMLGRNEPGVPALGGRDDNGSFRIHIPRDVLDYEGIATLGEFFQRRPQRPLMQRRVDLNSDVNSVLDLGDQAGQPTVVRGVGRPSGAELDGPEARDGPAALELHEAAATLGELCDPASPRLRQLASVARLA